MTIQNAVAFYKDHFSECWEEEKYKWVAVKHFRDTWDIEAEDFAGMLEDAFSLASNLLQGGRYYAYSMLCIFARQSPERIRKLFKTLYNEALSLSERFQEFRTECEELLDVMREQRDSDDERALNHYQDLRALSVYMAFRYPDKYFLYKYKMYSAFKKLIDYKETSTETNSDIKRFDNYMRMCQAVLAVVKEDEELLQMQQKQLGNELDCDKDEYYHLLVQSIIYSCSWKIPSNYTETGAAIADEDVETTHYWLYSPGDGAEIWDECCSKGIMAIGWDPIGDFRAYSSKDEMKQAMKEKIDPSSSFKNAAHATWQFLHEMKPGDVVFAKKGMRIIIGRGVVESDYEFDSVRKQYKNIRRVKWTHKGEWQHPGQAAMKTLTDITSYTDYVEKLNALFESDMAADDEKPEKNYPAYDAEMFLSEVFMDEDSYKTLVALIQTKKNVILQGAPGVGKTFAAKRLAYSMLGVKDPSRVMMIQFHQSYSYEDFIMGFRPSEQGFELKRGAFYSFCKDAEIDSDNDYFFIIDEINRGNISKIFGELFMLIENDKRGIELQLLYSDEKFSIPSNVYIIGMMNTADRSLAMLDYALRRRFAFYEMKPGFDTEGFREYKAGLANDKFDKLIRCVEDLNTAIAADESLGEGFCIGHSFFCNLKKATDQVLSGIVEYELIPLLKEYWFDEPGKVREWIGNLRGAIK